MGFDSRRKTAAGEIGGFGGPAPGLLSRRQAARHRNSPHDRRPALGPFRGCAEILARPAQCPIWRRRNILLPGRQDAGGGQRPAAASVADGRGQIQGIRAEAGTNVHNRPVEPPGADGGVLPGRQAASVGMRRRGAPVGPGQVGRVVSDARARRRGSRGGVQPRRPDVGLGRRRPLLAAMGSGGDRGEGEGRCQSPRPDPECPFPRGRPHRDGTLR